MTTVTIHRDETSEKSCCGPTCCGGTDQSAEAGAAEVTAVVREKYGQVARGTLSSNDPGVRQVAQAFGYSADELTSIPAEANMGLSCGNPIAAASLKPGEVVVDLGSGGGLDVFLASKKVGPRGRAIGIDMTADMIARARKGAAEGGFTNVEFHQASIDRLPLPDASVDCIISNCVINLAPDKMAVFHEMFRVLKPGGRVAVSDIALIKDLPAELESDLTAVVGCVAGAIPVEQYRTGLVKAGFSHVAAIDSGADLNAYAAVDGQSGCCSPSMESAPKPAANESSCCTASCCQTDESSTAVHKGLTGVLTRYDINEFAASVKVFAVKPE
jgi:arsenite methyltransferase